MVNPFKKNEKDVEVRQTQVLSASTFFGRKSGGYCERDEFLAWGESSRAEDVNQVRKFLELVRSGYKVVNTSTPRSDRGGIPYKYLTFFLTSKFSDGVKLVQNGPWPMVLTDLQKGLIEINFTLDELIEEAKKA